jgi:hypothetical protein
MADPTLTKTHVKFGYSASDGYRMSYEAKGGAGTKHLETGSEVPPQLALTEALRELTRILHLFGFDAEAQQAFDDARKAINEWRAARGVSVVDGETVAPKDADASGGRG